MELYFVDDTFGGHTVYVDHVELADPVFFQQCIRQTTIQYLEEDTWRLMYVDGLIDFHRRQMDLIHYSGAREAIYHEMGRESRNPSTYLTIEGRAIMRGPFAAVPFAPLPPVQ